MNHQLHGALEGGPRDPPKAVVCCGDKFEVAQDRAMVSRGELNYELYKEAYFNMTDFATAVGLSVLTPEIFMAQRLGAAARGGFSSFNAFKTGRIGTSSELEIKIITHYCSKCSIHD